MFRHILVPTDGSELSQKAIDGAIDLARAVGAQVTAYACLPQYPYSPFSEVIIEPPADFRARSEREARAHLDEVQAAAREAGVVCDSWTSVHPSPYLGIIEAAERGGCDVIFMASHGRRGLGSLLIGSETQRYPNVHVFDTSCLDLDAALADNAGESGDWVNEIHLTWRGYEKLAVPWAATIETAVGA